MSDRGLAARDDRGWKLKVPLRDIALEVPQKLRGVIDSRIRALSPEEQQVLEAASVEGQTFSATVSAKAANFDQEIFEDVCERLSSRQHIVEYVGYPETLRWRSVVTIQICARACIVRRATADSLGT